MPVSKGGPVKTGGLDVWRPGDYGALAISRFYTRGHLPSAILLYHLRWRLRGTNGDCGKIIRIRRVKDPNSGKRINEPVTERSGPKHKVLERLGYEWVAASRATWAKEAGLTLREYDTAMRRLRAYGLIVARNYKLGTKVSVWIRVVWEAMPPLKPDEVALHEMKRADGFRDWKMLPKPIRSRMDRKKMRKDVETFTGKIAQKAGVMLDDETDDSASAENSGIFV
jgi:hypothetical protein